MKKVSELTEANEINDEDIVMIIQNGENKQARTEKIINKLKLATNPIRFDFV